VSEKYNYKLTTTTSKLIMLSFSYIITTKSLIDELFLRGLYVEANIAYMYTYSLVRSGCLL